MYYFGVESQAKFVNREVTKEEERFGFMRL